MDIPKHDLVLHVEAGGLGLDVAGAGGLGLDVAGCPRCALVRGWTGNPDDWPYTPPIEVFLALAETDRHLWWTVGCGHHQNLFDEAVERINSLEDRA